MTTFKAPCLDASPKISYAFSISLSLKPIGVLSAKRFVLDGVGHNLLTMSDELRRLQLARLDKLQQHRSGYCVHKLRSNGYVKFNHISHESGMHLTQWPSHDLTYICSCPTDSAAGGLPWCREHRHWPTRHPEQEALGKD